MVKRRVKLRRAFLRPSWMSSTSELDLRLKVDTKKLWTVCWKVWNWSLNSCTVSRPWIVDSSAESRLWRGLCFTSSTWCRRRSGTFWGILKAPRAVGDCRRWVGVNASGDGFDTKNETKHRIRTVSGPSIIMTSFSNEPDRAYWKMNGFVSDRCSKLEYPNVGAFWTLRGVSQSFS